MNTQLTTSAKKSTKNPAAKKAGNTIVAQTHYQKELIERFFTCCQNKLVPSQSIERYCHDNNIDVTLIGVTDGEFYTTVSRQHKSFKELQKIGILTHKGKDAFTNHIVIPILDGAEITGLKFADLQTLPAAEAKQTQPVIESLNKESFTVRIKNRQYIIKNLVRGDHQLKAVVKFISGNNSHVDVINFYSAGNRKRLAQDICENLFFPYAEIRDDMNHLLTVCENGNPYKSQSDNASLLHKAVKDSGVNEFTVSDLVKLTDWQRMTVHRALEELISAGLVTQTCTKRPQKYKLSCEIT